MDEARWVRCTDPEPMLAFLQDKVTERLLRRFSIACHRRLIPITSAEEQAWFDEAERITDGTGGGDAGRSVAGGDFTFESFSMGGGEPTNLIRWPPGFYVQAVTNREGLARISTRAERAAQCHLLRDIVGNPFRPAAFDTAWLLADDGRVPRIARAIYEEERFDGLPVLADALLDAGCDDEAIVAHLREPGPDVRGCWALDLCLGRRLVRRAVVGGDAQLLTALIRTGADLPFLANEVGQHDGEESLLTLAVWHGHAAVVQALLDAGADPRGVDSCGETPMGVAASRGHWEIVRLLLAAGATANDGLISMPLIGAVMYGHVDVARELLRAGAAVDAMDEEGWSALMTAAFRADLPMVRLLVEAGASLTRPTREYEASALIAAGRSNSPQRDEVIRYLRQFATPEQIRVAEEVQRAYEEQQAAPWDDDIPF
jgi:hypothetical protein